MRSSFVTAFLFFVALPLANVFAQHGMLHHHHHHHGAQASCGCGVPAPAPCDACNACNTCNTCNTGTCGVSACGIDPCGSGCSSCGRGLCSNPALFYEVLYSEFYARNPWYLEHKQRESAARRARMLGQDPDAAPAKAAEPIKVPEPKKVAEPKKT